MIQKILWAILALLAFAVATLLPDLDRACDRDPGNTQHCTNPEHHHTTP